MATRPSDKNVKVVDLIHNSDSESAHGDPGTIIPSLFSQKRKREEDPEPEPKPDPEDFSEKVHFTDDSDTVPVKPKKRRAKRKSSGKRKGAASTEDEDENDLDGVPDYVRERRLEFDEKRKNHHDAALMLPPDYTGLQVAKASSALAERPKFEEGSGVKTVRPHEDIELPESSGLIPASIAKYLRDYQIVGAAFLHRKFVFQEGGILGDDMGLGKTIQVVAFLTAAFGKTGDERDDLRMRQVRYGTDRWYPRILIVCPGSLIMNWRNELARWGWWHIDVYHGAKKADILQTARGGHCEIMITTYDTYKNSRSAINLVSWDAVIADECHRIKDRNSETTKAMNEINALCRIGLTGTAIQNRYEELWTLLDWTNPGFFGTLTEWRAEISKPLTVGQSHAATAAQLSLARQTAKKLVENLLPRFFLRRMKSLISDQLPKKLDRVVFCPLTDLQKDAYENFLDSENIRIICSISETCRHGKKKGWCCEKLLPNGKSWQSAVFPGIMVMQKLANHLLLMIPQVTLNRAKLDAELEKLKACMPITWKLLYEEREQFKHLLNPEFCGKWKVLKKLLKFWHSNGDKVLVFSHSVRLLRMLKHLFLGTSYSVSYLDGSLSYEQRQNTVDTFNSNPSEFVFLISTKAGGVGLNITAANKVVIFDPHWNPSWDLQAQDRAYRIGQTRDVEVFRLISLGTVEEIVYARQIYKQQQANIGYTASSERRYFRGVQQDTERQGEIFGMKNIFAYHPDSGLLKDIVNKTNIAEAKAGVQLADVDMEKAANDDENIGLIKREEGTIGEDGGLAQLADLLTAKDQDKILESRRKASPRKDAIQAILTSAGIEYTHDNADVIGTSKIEEQLSRRAANTNFTAADLEGQSALFAETESEAEEEIEGPVSLHSIFKPPALVQRRHFCEMAREFGFASAQEFALIVESWTQDDRRRCLDLFYQRRKAKLADATGTGTKVTAKASTNEDGAEVNRDAEKKRDADSTAKNSTSKKVSRYLADEEL